jgi:hypothetical protein
MYPMPNIYVVCQLYAVCAGTMADSEELLRRAAIASSDEALEENRKLLIAMKRSLTAAERTNKLLKLSEELDCLPKDDPATDHADSQPAKIEVTAIKPIVDEPPAAAQPPAVENTMLDDDDDDVEDDFKRSPTDRQMK